MIRTKTTIAARSAAALLAVAAGVWFGPGAGAAPTIEFTDCRDDAASSPQPTASPVPSPPPVQPCVPRNGDVVGETVVPAFRVVAGGVSRIKEVRVYIKSEDPSIPSPGTPQTGNPVAVWSFATTGAPSVFEHPRGLEDDFVWDTRSLTPYNGSYTFEVQATNHSPDNSSSFKERTRILVDHAPQAPKAPVVVTATKDGVSLEWDANPEPDIETYTLYRARTNSKDTKPKASDFAAVAVTSDTETFNETPAGGFFWYKLQATRHSPVTPTTGISSEVGPQSVEAGFVDRPTPTPEPVSPLPDTTPGQVRSRPPLVPRALPRRVNAPAPVPQAPFSFVLPYDEEAERDNAAPPDVLANPDDGDDQAGVDRGAIPAIAMGAFLVSAALALGRMPV